MDDDAIAKALDLGAIIEKDLRTPRRSFIAAMANDLRADAIDAVRALIVSDPEDAKGIRAAQNEVRRLQDFVAWVRGAQHAKHEVMQAMPLEELKILRDLIGITEPNDA